MLGVLGLKATCVAMLAACSLVALQSRAIAEEERVHANVGSFWNYETTDEIKQTKLIFETTLTEANGDERVIRPNNRGQSASTVWVYDKNWNLAMLGAFKYQPNNGQGIPEPLQIGAKSKADVTFTQQLATGWTDPRPMTAQVEVISTENATTKAGQFETYRLEITTTVRGSPNQPLSVSETKTVMWFAPKIDHWVRTEFEHRTDGHLLSKSSSELIEYRVR